MIICADYVREMPDDSEDAGPGALLRCMKKLKRGATLIVWKLHPLGRRLRDLIAILDDLKTRGVPSLRKGTRKNPNEFGVPPSLCILTVGGSTEEMSMKTAMSLF